jgi:hypothetical protein
VKRSTGTVLSAIVLTCSSLLVLPGYRTRTHSDQWLCWQPGAYSNALVSSVRALVGNVGALADTARAGTGFLPESAESVYVVTDSVACRRAAIAVTSHRGQDTTSLFPVLLLKAGTLRYVIDDGDSRAGEYSVSYVADTGFNIVGGWLH